MNPKWMTFRSTLKVHWGLTFIKYPSSARPGAGLCPSTCRQQGGVYVSAANLDSQCQGGAPFGCGCALGANVSIPARKCGAPFYDDSVDYTLTWKRAEGGCIEGPNEPWTACDKVCAGKSQEYKCDDGAFWCMCPTSTPTQTLYTPTTVTTRVPVGTPTQIVPSATKICTTTVGLGVQYNMEQLEQTGQAGIDTLEAQCVDKCKALGFGYNKGLYTPNGEWTCMCISDCGANGGLCTRLARAGEGIGLEFLNQSLWNPFTQQQANYPCLLKLGETQVLAYDVKLQQNSDPYVYQYGKYNYHAYSICASTAAQCQKTREQTVVETAPLNGTQPLTGETNGCFDDNDRTAGGDQIACQAFCREKGGFLSQKPGVGAACEGGQGRTKATCTCLVGGNAGGGTTCAYWHRGPQDVGDMYQCPTETMIRDNLNPCNAVCAVVQGVGVEDPKAQAVNQDCWANPSYQANAAMVNDIWCQCIEKTCGASTSAIVSTSAASSVASSVATSAATSTSAALSEATSAVVTSAATIKTTSGATLIPPVTTALPITTSASSNVKRILLGFSVLFCLI